MYGLFRQDPGRPSTSYHIDAKRGKPALDDMAILPYFNGTLVHDHWKSYYQFTHLSHALCNAHHLRELKSFEEEGQKWATKMRAYLKTLCHYVNQKQQAGETALSSTILETIQSTYQSILSEGGKELPFVEGKDNFPGKRGRKKQSKGRNLLQRLINYEQDVLRFAYDFRVPFTNNQAERDIRMVKLKQKISGCLRSIKGAKMFARITGYLSTLRKQKMNIASAMTHLAEGNPILPNFC